MSSLWPACVIKCTNEYWHAAESDGNSLLARAQKRAGPRPSGEYTRGVLVSEHTRVATPLNVLIVEDSADDAVLLARELRRGGFDAVAERVETAQAMRDAL